LSLFIPKYLPQHPILQIPQTMFFSLKEPKFHTHTKWAKLYFCVF
jgi:hypothetical protein